MCLRKQNQWNVTFVKFHQKDKLGSSTMSHLDLPRLGLCSFWVLKCFIHPKNLSNSRIANQNPYTIKLRIEFSKTKKSQSNKIAERERESTWFVWGLEWTNRCQTKWRSCHVKKFLEFSLFRNKRFNKSIDELNSHWRGFNRWWWRMQAKQDKALPVPL